MGHIINPIRFRLGNSVFWANNWPALEKTKYFLSYEIHQEMDQYFRTLLFYFRKYKIKRRRKNGKKLLRKNRFPKIYFSNVNVNFFGLNLDKVMVDVHLYDFFLDDYIEEALSPQALTYNPILPGLSEFLIKFNKYVGFEFFFKHKRILQRLSKQQFVALLAVCRKKVNLLQQIAINKLQIFIEIYIEFMRRSLFSVYNDKYQNFNPTAAIFNKEKRLLYRLSFTKRARLVYRYWKQKYALLNKEQGSLVTFNNFFTSEFYKLITHRKLQNNYLERKNRYTAIRKAYSKEKKLYDKQLLQRHNLISPIFSSRIVERFEKLLKKTNTALKNPGIFNPNNPAYNTYPKEVPSKNYTKHHLRNVNVVELQKKKKTKKIQLLDFNFCNFINEFILCTNNKILFFLHKWLKLNTKSSLISITALLRTEFQNIKKWATTDRKRLVKYILRKNLTYNLKIFLQVFKGILPERFYNIYLNFYKSILKFKALNYQYIKQAVKNSATYWLKYTMDPFYQKYMEYKKLKNLYLNINIGIGPVDDKDHDIIDAKFLTLYIKRLFKQRRFTVDNLQRTMYRSLCRLPYIEGFVIIFAGRFTRRESKIYKVTKKGILHFGAISKLIDYHTIGFASKFGYCGVKVFIQYKANWPTIEQQSEKRLLEIAEPTIDTRIPTTLEQQTQKKVHIEPLSFKENSKRYTRLLQNLFAKNKIPYYYND